MNSIYIFLWTSLRLAFKQLMRNKVRSFLTMLGLFIGVGGVVAIVSLGEGLRSQFQGMMADVATDDMVYIMPDVPMQPGRVPNVSKPFKNRDLNMVLSSDHVIDAIAINLVQDVMVKHGWRSERAVAGLAPRAYYPLDGWKISRGRFQTVAEDRGRAMVCIIGDEIEKRLYEDGEDALGSDITLNGMRFTVIGILKKRTAMEGGQDANTMVFTPLTTGQVKLTSSDDLFFIAAKVHDSTKLTEAKEDIAARLRASRRIRSGADDDFNITTPDDWAEFGNNFVNTLIMVFGVVAVIALCVGGIGVMNIMLVSVRERTREIGLRKAIGATSPQIIWQFLVEAITLTILGGIGGMLLGYGLGAIVALVMKATLDVFWMPHVPMVWIASVLGTSIGIGLIFGVYPAYRAGQLNPIDALRYE